MKEPQEAVHKMTGSVLAKCGARSNSLTKYNDGVTCPACLAIAIRRAAERMAKAADPTQTRIALREAAVDLPPSELTLIWKAHPEYPGAIQAAYYGGPEKGEFLAVVQRKSDRNWEAALYDGKQKALRGHWTGLESISEAMARATGELQKVINQTAG